VGVSSRTSLPGLSRTKAVKRLCVCHIIIYTSGKNPVGNHFVEEHGSCWRRPVTEKSGHGNAWLLVFSAIACHCIYISKVVLHCLHLFTEIFFRVWGYTHSLHPTPVNFLQHVNSKDVTHTTFNSTGSNSSGFSNCVAQ